MSLNDRPLNAQIAVSNLDRAGEFYEGKLGLTPDHGSVKGTRSYRCGGGTRLHLYAAPAHAGRATGTVARWDVDDLSRTVDELSSRGVIFERYGEPVPTNEKGIHDSGYGQVAWFKDPDGNIFALEQV